MKSKYLFWVLLGLLVVVLSLVYVLKVNRSAQTLSENVRLLNSLSESAIAKAPGAVGKDQVTQLETLQKKVQEDVVTKLEDSFTRRDAEHLDLWFDDLKTPWTSFPLVEDFQRHYQLSRDRLAREATGYLEEQGVTGVAIALMNPEPMVPKSDATKTEREAQKVEMRRRQREFWVQDRLVRLFARVGAWLSRPIQGGESSGIVGTGVSSAAFERTRFDVRVRAKGERLLDVIHALDAPVTLADEDGGLMTVAISAIVDNVVITNLELDLALVEKWQDEPPVEVHFYLTILDYHERAKR